MKIGCVFGNFFVYKNKRINKIIFINETVSFFMNVIEKIDKLAHAIMATTAGLNP